MLNISCLALILVLWTRRIATGKLVLMKNTKKWFTALTLLIAGNAAAAEYELDVVHTQVLFSASHLGFSTSTGSFADIEGGFSFDESDIESSSVQVEIQVDSIDLNDQTWNDTMLGEHWFDSANYPTITFKSTDVRSTGEGTMAVVGDLTMKGVTKPLTLEIRLNKLGEQMGKPKAGFSATAIIDRTEFNLKTFAPLIGSEVSLAIEVEADRI